MKFYLYDFLLIVIFMLSMCFYKNLERIFSLYILLVYSYCCVKYYSILVYLIKEYIFMFNNFYYGSIFL